jgi:hypothetical protein
MLGFPGRRSQTAAGVAQSRRAWRLDVTLAGEALLFDLGRVVILDSSRAAARWAELAGVAPAPLHALLAARIAGGEAFSHHERGENSDAAFFAHLRSR